MRQLLIFPFLAISLFAQSGGNSINVPIQNPSFEQAIPLLSPDQCGPWATGVPSWNGVRLQIGGSWGVFQPANPNPCEISSPPDGATVLYLFQASVSQDVGASLPDGFYTLSFYVASRFYWYPGKYKASFTAGEAHLELCETSGYSTGDFTKVVLVCPVQRPNGELVLTLSSNGDFQLLLDNVSLTFTPQS